MWIGEQERGCGDRLKAIGMRSKIRSRGMAQCDAAQYGQSVEYNYQYAQEQVKYLLDD